MRQATNGPAALGQALHAAAMKGCDDCMVAFTIKGGNTKLIQFAKSAPTIGSFPCKREGVRGGIVSLLSVFKNVLKQFLDVLVGGTIKKLRCHVHVPKP